MRVKNSDTEGLHKIDEYVGKRMRLRRQMLNITQQKLAELSGVTFQQIQKYEKGKNRISASRLWDLCRYLEVEPNFFFEGLTHLNAKKRDDPLLKSETLELVDNYYRIRDRKIADGLFDIMRRLSKTTLSE